MLGHIPVLETRVNTRLCIMIAPPDTDMTTWRPSFPLSWPNAVSMLGMCQKCRTGNTYTANTKRSPDGDSLLTLLRCQPNITLTSKQT